MESTEAQADRPSVAAARLAQVIESRFADGLEAAREPVATGPGAEPGSLADAYLELLKLALCDLVSSTTTSVLRTENGHVMSRELAGADRRLRSAGLDWPLHGLTMVGLARLDDLQSCIATVLADGVPGDVVEAGSWRGGAALLMRAALNVHGATDRQVWVADSFQGFPRARETGGDGYDLSTDLAGIDFLAVPLAEVQAAFTRLGLRAGVTFVPGFFQETLPTLRRRRWSLVRLDGDTYESVRAGLDCLYPGLSAGGYLVIDDYYALEECRQAVQDFRAEHGIDEAIEPIDWNSARWRRRDGPDAPALEPESESHPSLTVDPPQPVPRDPHGRIPALAEVELGEELAGVRRRLAHAEAELAQLRSSPLAGPLAWTRATLQRATATLHRATATRR